MTNGIPPSSPCAPQCDVPSLPPVLVGALMRHYRTQAGQSSQRAADVIGASASRIGAMEKARAPLATATTRALLDAFGAPAHEVQEALALLTRPGHQHHLDDFAASEAWHNALRASARSAVVFSTGLPGTSLPLPKRPAAAASGRQPASSASCRTTLLLHESVLNRTPGGLSHLLRLAEDRVITVHLVPEPLAQPTMAITEYTCTAWGWDGSNAQRLRRQIYVIQHPGTVRDTVRNGPAAAAERQLLEEAIRRAMPSQWSLRQLGQAARAPQQPLTEAPGSRSARPTADAAPPTPRTRRSA